MASEYGGVNQAHIDSFLRPDEATSASDSDSSKKLPSKEKPRAYRLWSHEVKEGVTIHDAIDNLGESYTSGKISRFEFENRSSLIANFSKYKPPDGLPFVVEEPNEDGGDDDVGFNLHDCFHRCSYAATKATRLFCLVFRDLCAAFHQIIFSALAWCNVSYSRI